MAAAAAAASVAKQRLLPPLLEACDRLLRPFVMAWTTTRAMTVSCSRVVCRCLWPLKGGRLGSSVWSLLCRTPSDTCQ